MARITAMNLPSDILAVIFVQNGLEKLSGVKERCECSLVCRSWHEVLSQPQFQQACRINIGLFVDKLDRLARHLHRVSNRYPKLRELEWHGHLRGDSYRVEEHLLQPALMGSWTQLRVLRLSDCAVSAACMATVGRACPHLEELRCRTASASYSPERVTARSELICHSHIMDIVQGCKRLKMLDVACRGSTPFARHFEPRLTDSIAAALPDLQELTIFGRFAWDMLGSLAAMSQLQRLTLFGLEYSAVRLPQTLPEISTSVTHLTLEEFAMDSKTFVPLANALPCLEEVHVSMLPLAPTLGHYCPAPANAAGLLDAHAAMDADRLKDMSALALYYGQPFWEVILNDSEDDEAA